jgi:hypothetical protein
MFKLKYWERGRRLEGAFGIEISETFSDLGARLGDRFYRNYEYTIHPNHPNGKYYYHLLKGGDLIIENKCSLDRGEYSDIELRGDSKSKIEKLAQMTSLPFALHEIEEVGEQV